MMERRIARFELTIGTTFKVLGVTKGREESSFGSSLVKTPKNAYHHSFQIGTI
jgi:hypothetical protein